MPCDSIQTTTVEWGKNTDRKALEAALGALGLLAYGYDLSESGTLTLYGGASGQQQQQLRREYSKQVVLAQAQKFGWRVAPLEEGRKEVRHVRV